MSDHLQRESKEESRANRVVRQAQPLTTERMSGQTSIENANGRKPFVDIWRQYWLEMWACGKYMKDGDIWMTSRQGKSVDDRMLTSWLEPRRESGSHWTLSYI